MSGHSKWAQIKRQKGAADAKKGALYTKLGHAIALAVREGGKDPAMNVKLRLALDKAKASNMPNATIDRAIARGAGEGADQQMLEEVLYEGFAPGSSALLVEAVTDNRNRTNAEIRRIISKAGGSLGSSGSVQWQFESAGEIFLTTTALTDEQELLLIDAGADDISRETEGTVVRTKPDKLEDVKRAAEKNSLAVENAEIGWVPKTPVTPKSDAQREQIQCLVATLEELDEVTRVTTNAAL